MGFVFKMMDINTNIKEELIQMDDPAEQVYITFKKQTEFNNYISF